MNRKKWYCLITVFCCLLSVSAQQTGELKKVPAQVSIVYPIGTNGRQSPHHLYNFSFNFLTGKIGGLRGMEISGLFGQVERNLLGLQVAGLGNVVGGGMNGMQVSGLANIIGNGATGLQISGLTNITGNRMQGIQVTGLTNIAGEGMNGMQVAGITNIVGSRMQGIQVASFANIVGDGMNGIQVTGFANIIGNGMNGIQVASLANIVGDEMNGMQVAGLANIAGDEMKGLQIAGLANVVGNEMKGIQVGLYNRVHTSKGLQIGLVSVNDTVANGVSLSLIHIVKKGAYREWELSFSDYANVALSYKMGVQKFYTVYTAGVNFIEDNLWTFGIGFGNRTRIGNRFDFQPELVHYTYFPTNFKHIQNTSATQLKLGFVYCLNEKFGLSLAPGIYVLNAEKRSNYDSKFYRISPLGALYTHKSGNLQTTVGVGISIGLSIK